MSILRYKFKVNEVNETIQEPNVQYECRARNELGSANQIFQLRIRDLPTK